MDDQARRAQRVAWAEDDLAHLEPARSQPTAADEAAVAEAAARRSRETRTQWIIYGVITALVATALFFQYDGVHHFGPGVIVASVAIAILPSFFLMYLLGWTLKFIGGAIEALPFSRR